MDYIHHHEEKPSVSFSSSRPPMIRFVSIRSHQRTTPSQTRLQGYQEKTKLRYKKTSDSRSGETWRSSVFRQDIRFLLLRLLDISSVAESRRRRGFLVCIFEDFGRADHRMGRLS